MKSLFLINFVCLILLQPFYVNASDSQNGTVALVLLDMQDFFIDRDGFRHLGNNEEKLRQAIDNQLRVIDLAIENSIPILLVEYDNVGETVSILTDSLASYEPFQVVKKSSDGLFDKANFYKDEALDTLEGWGSETLIFMGANAQHCVYWSIRGALDLGYDVKSFGKGIIDFNVNPFIFPFLQTEELAFVHDPVAFFGPNFGNYEETLDLNHLIQWLSPEK